MANIPDILAELEANPEDKRWAQHAQVVMLQLAEKHMKLTEAFDRFAYERDLETLDRLHGLLREHHLHGLLREHHRRLKIMLPPSA